MSSVSRNSFISSFLICMLFISLCGHLILLAKTSGAMAHRNESRPSFATNLRKKALCLSPVSVKLAPPHTALSMLGGGGGLVHWQWSWERWTTHQPCLALPCSVCVLLGWSRGPAPCWAPLTFPQRGNQSTACFYQADFLRTYGSRRVGIFKKVSAVLEPLL